MSSPTPNPSLLCNSPLDLDQTLHDYDHDHNIDPMHDGTFRVEEHSDLDHSGDSDNGCLLDSTFRLPDHTIQPSAQPIDLDELFESIPTPSQSSDLSTNHNIVETPSARPIDLLLDDTPEMDDEVFLPITTGPRGPIKVFESGETLCYDTVVEIEPINALHSSRPDDERSSDQFEIDVEAIIANALLYGTDFTYMITEADADGEEYIARSPYLVRVTITDELITKFPNLSKALTDDLKQREKQSGPGVQSRYDTVILYICSDANKLDFSCLVLSKGPGFVRRPSGCVVKLSMASQGTLNHHTNVHTILTYPGVLHHAGKGRFHQDFRANQ